MTGMVEGGELMRGPEDREYSVEVLVRRSFFRIVPEWETVVSNLSSARSLISSIYDHCIKRFSEKGGRRSRWRDDVDGCGPLQSLTQTIIRERYLLYRAPMEGRGGVTKDPERLINDWTYSLGRQ